MIPLISEAVRNTLISFLSPAFTLAVAGGVWKFYRFYTARKDQKSDAQLKREAQADADFAAEEKERRRIINVTQQQVKDHTKWDYELIAALTQLQRLYNMERVEHGKEPIAFEPIKDPPNYFAGTD